MHKKSNMLVSTSSVSIDHFDWLACGTRGSQLFAFFLDVRYRHDGCRHVFSLPQLLPSGLLVPVRLAWSLTVSLLWLLPLPCLACCLGRCSVLLPFPAVALFIFFRVV